MILLPDAAEELKRRVESLDWKPDDEGEPSVRIIELFGVIDFMVVDNLYQGYGCYGLPSA